MVVDLLQPIFRKDEETAWTIVKSQQSTKPSTMSMFSDCSFVTIKDDGQSAVRRFDFENDLILAPVYKRFLFNCLGAAPSIRDKFTPVRNPDDKAGSTSTVAGTREENGTQLSQPNAQSGLLWTGNSPRGGILPTDSSTSNYASTDTGTTHVRGDVTSLADNIDWTPDNITKILREIGGFSISVRSDLEEIQCSIEPFAIPKRSLPLRSLLKQHQMTPEEQAYVDAKLISGITAKAAHVVAEALDEGADINTRVREDTSPLRASLRVNTRSDVSALLLLYHETNIRYHSVLGDTILHTAVKNGRPWLIRRLCANAEYLRIENREGSTVLHVAASSLCYGLSSLKILSQICEDFDRSSCTLPDSAGRTALEIAVLHNHQRHALKLIQLGSDPSFCHTVHPRVGNGYTVCAIFLAVWEGHQAMLEMLLKECSDARSLINRKIAYCVPLLQYAFLHNNHKIGETLLLHGAEWREIEVSRNGLLEFANSGKTPVMLLTLISQGCLTLNGSVDVTRSVDGMLAECSINLATRALTKLEPHMVNPHTRVRTKLKKFPLSASRFYAYSKSDPTKIQTLEEILRRMITCKGSLPQGGSALTISDRGAIATDSVVP